MDTQIDVENAHDTLFLIELKKAPPHTAIIDELFMIRYGNFIIQSNVLIPYLEAKSEQHPIQTALSIFRFIG